MIADRIKYLRDQKGITQSDLARKIGITRSGVNSWEMGISVPSTQYIVVLAEFFDVSTDYLLGVERSSTISVKGLDQKDIMIVKSMIDHLRFKNGKIADEIDY